MAEENDGNNQNDGSNQNPDEGSNGTTGKIEFSPEQQTKVQNLIDEAHARAKKKADENREADLIDSNAKIEKLTEEVKALNKKPAQVPDGVNEYTKVIDALNAEKEVAATEFKALNQSVRNADKERALFGAISGHDVVDAQSIKTLLTSSIGINENGDVYVKGEGDSPKLDKHGEQISVKNFVTEWLAENPHFLRGSNGGAGGTGNMGGNGKTPKYDLSDPAVIRNMPQEDLDRLLKEGITIIGSANQKLRFGTQSNPFKEARKRKIKQG